MIEQLVDTQCVHCGELGKHEITNEQGDTFCCQGCFGVYSLLQECDLSDFYKIEKSAGRKINIQSDQYDYLDHVDVVNQLIQFKVEDQYTVYFKLPQIHCSACVWLLENLYRIHPGIVRTQVNFLEQECTVVFDCNQISLKEVAQLLARIGYAPHISLQSTGKDKPSSQSKRQWYQIGLAGFCFGNIMLLSFPDYFGLEGGRFKEIVGWLKIILAAPVVLYAAQDYWMAAWRGILQRQISIDTPIVIGIIALTSKSIFEIVSGTGIGYLDSLSGFVFFLLLGKAFQSYTYKNLSFDQDYKSFFPMSIKRRQGSSWSDIPVNQIVEGDLILVRHRELIPCDGILTRGTGKIDYSFVSGESVPVAVPVSESVYAGGRQIAGSLEISVTKPIHQSKLIKLWNEDIFHKKTNTTQAAILSIIGKYFTIGILVIAFMTWLYWIRTDGSMAYMSMTSVLIVACPCILALAIPFLYGSAIRLLNQNETFCKNTLSLLSLAKIDTIVFDKTGTLTDSSSSEISYQGKELSSKELQYVKSLVAHSSHPLSIAIDQFLAKINVLAIEDFHEYVGEGISASVDQQLVRLGSAPFILDSDERVQAQTVFVEIDGLVKGHFKIDKPLRDGVASTLDKLSSTGYQLSLLSGDRSLDQHAFQEIFPSTSRLLFGQSPEEKLHYIQRLKTEGRHVLMVGDGLNDAGALIASDVGMVLYSKSSLFAPAASILLKACRFESIPAILKYAKRLQHLLVGSFVLAAIYNLLGLFFAVQGQLSPIVAAILMPISSMSILVYGLVGSRVAIYTIFNKHKKNEL